jgi:tetraacyldisaccharide 4'-kinase
MPKPVTIHFGLYPLAWLYGLGVFIRNRLFDWGILPTEQFGIPVICIGNLNVGGSGKTPHTEYLIRLLLKQNYRVAVLSRGYKRHSRGYVLAAIDTDAQLIGDEPYQIKQKFPLVRVAVDEKRTRGIRRLMELREPPVDVILLDDAYQHRYVKAGLTILLTPAYRPYCCDALLPAGRLREAASESKRADIVILTKNSSAPESDSLQQWRQRLRLTPGQLFFSSRLEYGALYPLFHTATEERTLESITEDEYLLLLTAIAHPQTLEEKLKSRTFRVESCAFGDHHRFTAANLREVFNRFTRVHGSKKLIVTTQKDAARLYNNPHLAEQLKPFLYVLPVKVVFAPEQADSINQHITHYVRTHSRNGSLPKR